jgi:multidrug efflux pump
VATALLTLALVFAGVLGYFRLPIAPMPQVDYPIIYIEANMPGASPEAMAETLAAPLERRLGQIADVADFSSSSNYGSSQFQLVMNLSRNIEAAARDVMAAINAARADLPVSLRANPSYAK